MVQLDMFFEDISPIEASLVRVCCSFVTCNSSREKRVELFQGMLCSNFRLELCGYGIEFGDGMWLWYFRHVELGFCCIECWIPHPTEWPYLGVVFFPIEWRWESRGKTPSGAAFGGEMGRVYANHKACKWLAFFCEIFLLNVECLAFTWYISANI